MVHVGIQVKDSSNSLRRRHSSEGVDAKFGSTLPKDFAGEVVFDLIFLEFMNRQLSCGSCTAMLAFAR